jgi:hypothetical protein
MAVIIVLAVFMFVCIVVLLMQIEREVILSSADKNSKIPILHEYKKQRPKSASAAAIAPEGPNKQLAWTEDKKTPITTPVSTQNILATLFVTKNEENFVMIYFLVELFT